jgi:RNA polymerase sigma factor (TIGR02999 family)
MAAGDPSAAAELLPLVYDELRRLAAAKLAHEKPGQTLDATALVHEAYLRLVAHDETQHFSGKAHFFAAAAESIRRILIDNARRKQRLKHGGNRIRVELEEIPLEAPNPADDLLALDLALRKLKEVDPDAAQLIHLRYFAGLTMKEAAELLNLSIRSAERRWTYARAWLHREISLSSENR